MDGRVLILSSIGGEHALDPCRTRRGVYREEYEMNGVKIPAIVL